MVRPLNWDSGQLVVTTGTGAASLGIALSVSSADNSASITSLTPGVTWNPIHYRGSSHIFYKSDASTNEVARLDTSGRLLVGTSSARANFFNSVVSPQFQIEGAGDFERQAAIISSSSTAGFGGVQILAHQKSGAIGGNTLVASGDALGTISFQGSDGTEFVEGARIEAFVDGTPGADDMPGRLVFSTTADGASSPTERMRIANNGAISTVVPGGSTLYPAFDCRAWVNFNGTGTVAIRGSGNVSSITDNGVGNYSVNFTTAMADANYAAQVTSRFETGISGNIPGAYIYSTTGFDLQNVNASGLALADSLFLNVAIFR